jgi:hypothetical protein
MLHDATLPKVGLAWSGGTAHKNDSSRSIPLRKSQSFCRGGPQFVSLQKELRAEDESVPVRSEPTSAIWL